MPLVGHSQKAGSTIRKLNPGSAFDASRDFTDFIDQRSRNPDGTFDFGAGAGRIDCEMRYPDHIPNRPAVQSNPNRIVPPRAGKQTLSRAGRHIDPNPVVPLENEGRPRLLDRFSDLGDDRPLLGVKKEQGLNYRPHGDRHGTGKPQFLRLRAFRAQPCLISSRHKKLR